MRTCYGGGGGECVCVCAWGGVPSHKELFRRAFPLGNKQSYSCYLPL